MLKPSPLTIGPELNPASSGTRARFSLIAVFFFVFLGAAWGQGADFTLQVAAFDPFAVNPGQASAANITLGTLNGYAGTVNLSCEVTSVEAVATPPTCEVSPQAVRPSGGAAVTLTTSGLTTAASYTVVVTGADSVNAGLTHSASQPVSVLAVTPQFTITVKTTVTPSSVHAGSGGTGVISITPIYGYSGNVTLSCTSVSPVVTIPPVCTFNPPTVSVAGVVATSTLTINTTGTTTQAALAGGTGFSGFGSVWISVFGLVGMVGFAGKRSRRVFGATALLLVGGALLLTPGCGSNNSNSTPTQTGVTPNNTYTFKLSGVDENGTSSSNTGTSTGPSVSLTVN